MTKKYFYVIKYTSSFKILFTKKDYYEIFCNFIICKLFFLSSCQKEESYDKVNLWTKVELNSDDPLNKVIIKDGNVLIFSKNYFYLSQDILTWNKFSIPVRHSEAHYSKAPFPVVFNDNIYIDGKDGLYFLNSDLNWELVVSKNIKALAACNTYIYLFSTRGSYRSSDGLNFQELNSLNEIIKPIPRHPDLLITFAKGDKNKIVLAGHWLTGMAHIFTSYDYGISWERELTQIINDFDENVEILSNHGSTAFIARGDINIYETGGNFYGVKKINNDYFFAGLTNNLYTKKEKHKGILVINNFEYSCYFEERINNIEYFKEKVFLITNNGYLYYRKL